jgi:predicted ribosome quality control (RQC) complex YloA/Tae2 family protein
MDAVILQSVLPGLREALVGGTVRRVELVGRYGVLLRFAGPESGRLLYVSAHPDLSRLGRPETLPPGGPPRPAPDNLSEPLTGSRLVEVTRERAGRVVILRFEREAARHRAPVLVGELIPRFANVILVGDRDRILWSRREFTGDARPRKVAAGEVYVAPEPDLGPRLPDLDESTIAARFAEGEGPLHRRIPHGWGGGPRGPARVFEEAGLDVAARLADLAAGARDPLPRIARHPETGAVHLFPADPGEIPGWELDPAVPPEVTVDAYFRELEERETTETLLGDLRRVLVQRRRRAAKALLEVERRLEEAKGEAELRSRAELLTAHLDRVKRGMKSIRLRDFDGSREIEIELDPKKDGPANVESLFKRARRLARGRDELEAQRSIQEAEIAEADRGLAELDPPPDAERLHELVARHAPALAEGGPVRGGRFEGGRGRGAAALPGVERHPSLPEGFDPRVYELPGGWVVWVGRNARQNDELTHHRSALRDLWFHARGAQGSHTVLRTSSGKGEPPREIIEAAAAIAAWHSNVPVAYAEKRYVRRARKAPPGTAVMMREKVLMVEPALPPGVDR